MKARDFLKTTNRASWLIRIGLAFALLYAAAGSFTNPDAWAPFLPALLAKHFNAAVLLKAFAVSEVLLALWLLSGKYIRWAGAICALMLAGIVIANPHALDITFRDISLMFAALALVFPGKQPSGKA